MQYNVKPPGLQLEITSAQAVSQPCYSNSSGRHYKAEEHMHRQWWCITSTTALFEPEAIHYDFLYDTQELQCTWHHSLNKPYGSGTNYLEVWWKQTA